MKLEIENYTILRVLFAITAFVVVLWFVFTVRTQLAWIGAGMILAVALNPAVAEISRYLPRKSRVLATVLAYIIFLAVVAFLVINLLPPTINESKSLASSLPAWLNDLEHSNGALGRFIQDYHVVDTLQKNQDKLLTQATSGSVLGIIQGAFSGIAATITILAVGFFTLLEGPTVMKEVWRLTPTRARKRAQNVVTRIYAAIAGYVTGNLVIVFTTAVLTSVLLIVGHVPYAIPIGILTGVMTLLPLIGIGIGAAIAIAVAAFTSVQALLIMVVYFAIYLALEGHVLRPLIYSRTIHISPLLIVVAAILGTALGGLLGALVAIPIAASLKVLVDDFIEYEVNRKRA